MDSVRGYAYYILTCGISNAVDLVYTVWQHEKAGSRSDHIVVVCLLNLMGKLFGSDKLITRRQVAERRCAICPGRLRLHDAAGAAQKLKDCSRQQRVGLHTLLAHRDRAVRHFKIQRRRKNRIRLAVYRQNQLLNILIGDAHIEARLIIRRRHDLNRH